MYTPPRNHPPHHARQTHRDKVFIEHVFSSTAILSYILFWMIFYNICHVF